MKRRNLVLAIAAVVGLANTAHAGWYSPAWPSRRQLTLNGGMVPAAQTNFPVLVAWTADAGLAGAAQASGNDILFTAADGTTKLDHEIESYTSATGALAAWVRVPALASGSNTVVYMYYGNGGAANQQNATGVWQAYNYKGVWHLAESGASCVAGVFKDSSGNNNHGQSGCGFGGGGDPAATAAGRIGPARDFVFAQSDFISIPDSASLQVTGDLTLEAWAFARTWPDAGWMNGVVGRQYQAGAADSYGLWVNGADTNLYSWFNPGSVFGGAAGLGAWHHLVMTHTAAGTASLYIDGAFVTSTGGNTITTDANPVIIGGEENGAPGVLPSELWDGFIDEVRISNAVRTPGWIQTEYNNQANQGVGPGKFILSATTEGARMLVQSGTYKGNATAGRAIYVGFQPDAVFVKRVGGGTDLNAVLRTSTMTGDNTKWLDNAGIALAPNLVQSLTTTGFTVGSDNAVNEGPGVPCAAGCDYYWVAFKAAAGTMAVGSYGGNGAATQSITGVGFQPEFLIVVPPGASDPDGIPVWASSTLPVDSSFDFDATQRGPNAIRALQADGFQVGNGGVGPNRPNLNAGSTTYYYVAWNATPGQVAVGSYTGDGSASRNVDAAGFFPEWVWVKKYPDSALERAVTHKPASLGVGTDLGLRFAEVPPLANTIKTLRPLGFQVGSDERTNSNAACAGPCSYHWVAFGPHTPQANYRSIGTWGPYNAGTIAVTSGSPTVTGAGTAWTSGNNRGRGDAITIPCPDPPVCTGGAHYVVAAVASPTSLQLTQPFAGATASGLTYVLRRQFATLGEWEDCIDGGGSSCGLFPPVPSTSLVADDRSEVGIAYKDSVFKHSNGGPGGAPLAGGAPLLSIDGSTTDATHTITLTADGVNRSYGLQGNGVVLDDEVDAGNGAVFLFDDHVSLEWLEIKGGSGATAHGIVIGAPGASNQFNVRYNLVHDVGGNGVDVYQSANANLLLANNIIHHTGGHGVYLDPTPLAWMGQVLVLNNTVSAAGGGAKSCYKGVGVIGSNTSRVLLANNIGYTLDAGAALKFDFPDNDPANGWADVNPESRRNLSSDASANAVNITDFGVPVNGGTVNFVDNNVGVGNYHLNALNVCGGCSIDLGADLSALMPPLDIDGALRPSGAAWDIGADEYGATTAVKLQSFVALPGDAAVILEWRTASELDNLGFHLYRSLSEGGPWTRLTTSLIPGLGSSAVGRAYSFRDAGLVNGTRYFYRLEDVDASSKATSHGPVWAVPQAGAGSGAPGSDPPASGSGKRGATSPSCPDWVVAAYGSMAGASASSATLTCTRHGDPEAVSLGVVSRDSRSATLELRTGGFYSLREASGKVRVFVPGFDFPQDPQAAALPFRRALVDAVVGRRVQLGGVRALEQVGFPGLVPSSLGKAEMQVSRDGTVRPTRRALPAYDSLVLRGQAGRGDARTAEAFVRTDLATLLPSVFQGETKSAVVELRPLRFDAQRQQVVLAKRVLVKLLFTGRETGESGRGRFGRRDRPEKPASGEVLARLHTTSRGLYGVTFEQLFPGRSRGLAPSQLRLERQGAAIGFHVEPTAEVFGPGSRLYFFAEQTAGSVDYSGEVAYELVRSRDGLPMPLVAAVPAGDAPRSGPLGFASFEVNHFYQPGLLEAEDLWQWEALYSGTTRAESFTLGGVEASSPRAAELQVYLQGASESGNPIDHHIAVSVNGVPVGEAQFAGKKPYRMGLSVPPSLLKEGANELSLTNVADTGVTSYVFLDRFTIAHPQLSVVSGGRWEGTWPESGSAGLQVGGAISGPVRIVDVSGPVWLTGYETTTSAVRFRAEAGHRYWVGGDSALFSARVSPVQPSTLKSAVNQADYLLIAPQSFLAAAEPLLQRRHDQGLTTRAVAFEEIAAEFGHGQPSAEAIREFLRYAFHSWAQPSPKYVLLLGDASYDPRNFMGNSRPSPLPTLWAKTSYLWTVSDPQLAAVNGDDALPDLAIGRLPATTVEEAHKLISKLIAWEDSGQGLSGAAALVADNPDLGGDFEVNARDIAQSFLAGRSQLMLLSQLGAGTRPAIAGALDSGLSLLSYVGHGGAAVWASENVWNSWDAASLQAQSRQPLLVTMNCLNGYFVAPAFDSLSESLIKAEGRGAIAAFSPSGLSLDGPAHQYHRALMAELVSGKHQRLGDAVLAAQKAYVETGLMPELLSVYQLLGDPATRVGQ